MARLGDETIKEETGASNESLVAEKKDLSGADAAAFVLSAANGILPIGDVQTIVGWFSKDAAETLQATLDQNPTAAKSGMAIGTVVGLVGGPAYLAAKGGKLAVGFLSFIARGKAKGVTRKQIDEAKRIIKEKKTNAELEEDLIARGKKDRLDPDSVNDVDSYKAQLHEVKKLDKQWAALDRQIKADPGAKRDFFRSYIDNLSDTNPLKSTISNPYKNIFNNEVDKAAKVTGGTIRKAAEEVRRQVAHQLKDKALNIAPGIIESFFTISTDFGANFMWGYGNFRDQGFDTKTSKELAVYYALERSPQELGAEIVKRLAGDATKIGRMLGVGASIIKAAVRAYDLDHDTGNIEVEAFSGGGLIAPTRSLAKFRAQGGLVAL